MNNVNCKAISRLMAVLSFICFSLVAGRPACAGDIPVYADALVADWQNWSWSATLNFSNSAPVHSGSRSLSVQYTSAWAGLYLHPNAAYDTKTYDRVSFWVNGGSAGGQRIVVVANGDTTHSYPLTLQANAWTQVTIGFNQLGSPATLTDLYWQEATGGAQPVYYLDDITLLGGTVQPVSLSIDVNTNWHPISDDIYGMNFADESLATELRLPVSRWGGNSATRYNWKTSMTNTASDWFFENLQQGTVNVSALPSGSASDQFIDQNRRTGTRSIITVPLIGWTAKATSPRSHPYDCGFKVSTYGSQQAVDSWDQNCGNGLHADGSPVTGNNPTDTSDPITPDFVTAWVNHLVGKYGSAANNGVSYYNLDNEPMLWNSTHRDVHPLPVSYDEIRDRTYQYAAAVKTADPTSKTLGPVLWGWCAYLYSALDGCAPGSDYQAHGNLAFVPWYLGQMKAYEQLHQQRILDYLDLHYYPQASGVSLATAGSTATQALRLRSTRSLWDASYVDESWISDTATGGVKVRLIPLMRDWVNTYYPGTKLAITEYNWGGLESLNGALAQADVLGIFGREGLDLATLWSPPSSAQPGAFAFRLFRNYDGTGQGFGNASVFAQSSDQGSLSIYAAQRSTDNALTVLVVNKTGSDQTSPVNFTGATLPPTVAVYRYSAANLAAIVRLPNQTTATSGFSAVFPANSITLFVIPQGDPTLTVTKAGTGSGTVSTNTGALAWNGNTATAAYPSSTSVTLTATPGTQSSLASWADCDSSSGTSCSLTMNASKAVTATFNLNQYVLTAIASGSGSGSVTANVGGINFTYPAATSGSKALDYGTAVKLTATASNGSTVSWPVAAGACDSVTGTASQMNCNIGSMTAAKSVTATFTAPVCKFTLSPTSRNFTKTGGNGSVNTTASSSGCAWTAKSNVTWVTLTGSSFTGTSTVKYAVARNSTGINRSGTLTIAGATFTITQSK